MVYFVLSFMLSFVYFLDKAQDNPPQADCDEVYPMKSNRLINSEFRLALGPYLELTKPRIVTMVLVTTTIGFLLGARGSVSGSLLALTLLGTALAAGGSSALNNYLERELDGRMNRTKGRSLPSGRMDPMNALFFGVALVLSGVLLLAWRVNLLTGFLVLLTAFLYVLVYTPLKRLTWWNTSIGAIPGAIPPLSGWTASAGEIELGAWVLFLILFVWQHPHFYSIAWMYREDYEQAGYKMLPVVDPSGHRMCNHVLAYSGALILISVVPSAIGMTGIFYLAGASIISAGVLTAGLILANTRTKMNARLLLRSTIVYLPVLLGLIVVDGVL